MYIGRSLPDYYICIPPPITSDMTEGQKRQAMEFGIRLARACAAFKVKSDIHGLDTDEFIGREAMVTVKNGEYEGRMTSKVNDYYI
jgi:hypothetical protein